VIRLNWSRYFLRLFQTDQITLLIFGGAPMRRLSRRFAGASLKRSATQKEDVKTVRTLALKAAAVLVVVLVSAQHKAVHGELYSRTGASSERLLLRRGRQRRYGILQVRRT